MKMAKRDKTGSAVKLNGYADKCCTRTNWRAVLLVASIVIILLAIAFNYVILLEHFPVWLVKHFTLISSWLSLPSSSPLSSQPKTIPSTTPPRRSDLPSKENPGRKSRGSASSSYDPAAMVKFLDDILEQHVDDFVTVEQDLVKIADLVAFNKIYVGPRIASIVKLDPFKFVKFNLARPCVLWSDTFSCTKLSCNIQFCDKSELPESYLEMESCPTDSPKALSKVDRTLSQGNVKELNILFECSRDDSEESQYYDLILNPERFTGYDGNEIWNAIYEENCFASRGNANMFAGRSLDHRCYEERLFYRSISGLHTSISTHLTSIHHFSKDKFGPNTTGYYHRFYGKMEYLKNLFFIYLIELRALYKIEPYLVDKIKWNVIGDKVQAKDAIKALLSTEKYFRWHFDENVLFRHEPKPLAQQLAAHFHNITYNIMDCVSCDKCRLWGKVQTNGLGTAFKILLTKDISRLRLSHHEITCLLNALARLSFSVSQISNFRDLFHEQSITGGTRSSTSGSNGLPGTHSQPPLGVDKDFLKILN